MSILTGDRYLESLVKFVENVAGPLIEGNLVLKLNPVDLPYSQSRLEALAKLESLLADAPVDTSALLKMKDEVENFVGSHQFTEVAIVNFCWLQIDGSYPMQKLTKGMHYVVKFVVKLKDSHNITNPVDLTLTLPDGTEQQHRENLMDMRRKKILGITARVFQASKMSRCGDIKFSMTTAEGTDPAWKHGLAVIGAFIIPQI